MIRFASFLTVALVASPLVAADPPAGVPANYKLQFASDFAKPDALKDYAFPDPSAWRLARALPLSRPF